MLIQVVRENRAKTTQEVWEFVFSPGETSVHRFSLELVAYTKLKANKVNGPVRIVGRWAIGWNSTLAWTDVRLPDDVLEEVKRLLKEKVEYMTVRAGNNPLPILYNRRRLEAEAVICGQ